MGSILSQLALAIALLVGVDESYGGSLGRDVTIPDPRYTPGVSTTATLHKLCTTRWGTDRRFVTAKMKARVFANYRLTGNDDESQGCMRDVHGRRYELDHLIPRCAGGADVVANLWPNCFSGPWNAVMKDRLEVHLCKLICAGELSTQEVHELFTTDWQAAWRRYFGAPAK
jgi:hypothetical protein